MPVLQSPGFFFLVKQWELWLFTFRLDIVLRYWNLCNWHATCALLLFLLSLLICCYSVYSASGSSQSDKPSSAEGCSGERASFTGGDAESTVEWRSCGATETEVRERHVADQVTVRRHLWLWMVS